MCSISHGKAELESDQTGFPMHQVPKLKAAKANIRLDFMFADVMKQQGWVREATLLFVHTNFSAVDLRELRTRAGGMQVQYSVYRYMKSQDREHNKLIFRSADDVCLLAYNPLTFYFFNIIHFMVTRTRTSYIVNRVTRELTQIE